MMERRSFLRGLLLAPLALLIRPRPEPHGFNGEIGNYEGFSWYETKPRSTVHFGGLDESQRRFHSVDLGPRDHFIAHDESGDPAKVHVREWGFKVDPVEIDVDCPS